MEWETLTADEVTGICTSNERESFAKVNPSVSVADRLVPICANLVKEIRGMIATHSSNTLSANELKIPGSFKARALVMARHRMLSSIPGYNPGDTRKDEYNKADAFFLAVAKGSIRPEPADDAIATDVPSEKPAGVEVVSSPGSRTGRSRMDGI
jgi:hypothetical protein